MALKKQISKIALIQGGLGSEHDVSLTTGKCFAQALDELGLPYQVISADENLPRHLMDEKPDVALLAVHGKYAEDGTVQGICEYLKIPYTGSGVMASALCMDKYYSKMIYQQNDIPTPKFEILDTTQIDVANFKRNLSLPLVIKPSRDGSSMGVTIAKSDEDFRHGIQQAAEFDKYVLIEEFIDGMELTVAILGDRALTPIEIVPKTKFYDYENKYTAGNTDYILPPRCSESVLQECKKLALQTFKVCRARSYGRVDFRIDQNDQPYVIELNTLPGCTPTSLLPKAAAHDGISFEQLIEYLIDHAGLDYEGVR